MKTNNAIRLSIISAALILETFFIIASCGNIAEPEDPKVVAEELNDAKMDSSHDEKDAQFLVNAADISLEEIKLGQLAQQSGKTADIKELGKMMEIEHTKSLNDLTALASQKSITVPSATTENAEEAYKKLKDKSPENFDKEYCDMMVKGHEDAVSLFEKASIESSDADIQAWASATLPTLRKHLEHAQTCQKKLDKK